MKNKHYFRITLLLISAVLILSSCNREKISLGYNFENKKLYISELTGDMNLKQEMGGLKTDANTSLIFKTHASLANTMNDNLVITLSIDSMNMNLEMDVNGEKRDLKDFQGGESLLDIYKVMQGQFLTITMKPTGETVRVNGIDVWMDKIFDYMEENGHDVNPSMRVQLEEMYGDKLYNNQMQKMFIRYPVKEVAIGDQWNDTLNFTDFVPLRIVTTYKLKGYDHETAKIESTTNIRMDAGNLIVSQDRIPMKFDLTGIIESEYKVDRISGWILNGNIDYSFGGEIIVEKQAGMQADQVVPMDFAGKYMLTGDILE